MSKIKNISGFPEWLPEQKIVEDRVIQDIKAIYESHGFTPIETPAVELLSTLAGQGVVDKEIFRVIRAQEEGDAAAELGLHFDLSVPLVRYVVQHYNELNFPFKRYQLQKVWRGDRPQRGRFREFYQFDIDIVAREKLPLSCDAEVVTVIDKAFCKIPVGGHRIKLNSRKLLIGFYRSLGLSDEATKSAIVAVDKINKIGPEGVRNELTGAVGLSAVIAEKILQFSNVKLPHKEAFAFLEGQKIEDALFVEGVTDMREIFSLLSNDAHGRSEMDLSLARGLAYYTGIIVEVHVPKYPEFGSVSGGGRYDNLASAFMAQKLPGVGISIGITRLMDLLFSNKLVETPQRCPTAVLVTVLNEEQRCNCNAVAERLRGVGVATEVFYLSSKLGKQIEYAESKGISFVLFVKDDGGYEVKDLRSKEQKVVENLEEWAKTHKR